MSLDKDLSPLRLIVPAGIGDISWLYSKLVNTNRKIHLYTASGDAVRSGRAHPFTRLLPNVTKTADAGISTAQILAKAKRLSVQDLVELSEQGPVMCEANSFLEAGTPIAELWPELDTTYHYEVKQPAKYAQAFSELELSGTRYMCFYVAGVGQNKKWGGLTAEQWFDLMRRCSKAFDLEGIALVGATYDTDLSDQIQALADKNRDINLINLVGKTEFATTMEILRNAYYTIGFPSGVPIVAHVLDRPVMMFYPKHLAGLQISWANPERVASGRYKGCQFCSVDQAMGWILERRPMDVI